MEKQYIRGNTEATHVKCPNCGQMFEKQNGRQIVYFCSKLCRKEGRKPTKMEVIK